MKLPKATVERTPGQYVLGKYCILVTGVPGFNIQA
jgi:hypothetical protein